MASVGEKKKENCTISNATHLRLLLNFHGKVYDLPQYKTYKPVALVVHKTK
jgi:hypothetical protein